MKTINNYISEKLNSVELTEKLNISTKYSCQPKTPYELRAILKERLAKDKNADLNDIDVYQITNMNALFVDLDPHNIDISDWDVSNVTSMNSMFFDCKHFNSDLSEWDVSNVKDMNCMFYWCRKFNSDLSNWNVSNIEYMDYMFKGCDSLKNKPKWYKS